jgi:hypothetical protein
MAWARMRIRLAEICSFNPLIHMKANLIYRGPDGRKGFESGKNYTLAYDMEADTGFIVLDAGGKQVVYRDWNDFHSEWQVVEVLDAGTTRGKQ